MKTYYQDEYATIYHGDSKEIIKELPKFDLILTDPPYGIKEANGKNKSRSKLAISKDYGISSWDDKPIKDIITYVNKAERAIIFGGNYYDLPPSSCWFVWDKVNGDTDFADCELAWTNLRGAARLYKHMWHGMLKQKPEERFHPTQKPLDLMKWCILRADKYQDIKTILDPFMGSGTTLRAAKDLGRKSVGIELEEKYCEIAAKRLSQGVLNFGNG